MSDFRGLIAAVSRAREGMAWDGDLAPEEVVAPRMRPLDEVCRIFAADLPVDGVSMSVMTGTTVRETIGVSDRLADLIEEQQYTYGVGPCFDAFARPGPVLVPDVRDPGELRWPPFIAALEETPVRAVFAFPMLLGAVLVGAVDAYRTVPGLPDAAELRDLLRAVDLLVLALAGARGRSPAATPTPAGGSRPGRGDDRLDHLEARLLAAQTDPAPAGRPPPGRTAGVGEWEDFLHALPTERLRVHQATGMVMGQLGGTPEQALARLRAYSFANNRTITDVAADVVARRLRLPPD